MTKLPFLATVGSLAFASFSPAATVTVSNTAPVVDGADIANDNGSADGGGNQGHVWSNRPTQGQTFTTGSNAGGYQLNSVTLKNLNNTVTQNPTFSVVVGSVAGTVLTQIGSTESGVAPSYAPLDYITFNFDTPLTLNANTTYGFLWGSNSQGFVSVNNLDGSTYAGGTAISSGANSAPDLGNLIDRQMDRVFHADIETIPEASSSLLGLLGLAFAFRRRRA